MVDGELNIKILIRKVDLFTLKLFLTVTEEGHFGRAAQKENIAPSAVTKRIQEFEEVLGHRLFFREPSGVALTAVGDVVARHARAVNDTLSELRSDISEFSAGVRGHVRLYGNEASIIQFLAADLAAFLREHPLIEIELREDFSPVMARAVLTGAADLAVLAPNDGIVTEGLDLVPYRNDQLYAVVPRNHPLALRRSLLFSDLYEFDMISVRPETSVAIQLDLIASRDQRTLRHKYSVNSTLSASSLVRAGLGIAILPDGMTGSFDVGELRMIPLSDPWAKRSLSVATLAGANLTAGARLLLRHLTQQPQQTE